MSSDRRRKVLKIVGGAAAVGGAVVVAGLATTAASILGAALAGEPAEDDGPDELLREPTHPVRSIPVTAADGARINTVAYGPEDAEGDVVVLVHGWTCAIRFWNPQLNHLAERQQVIAYDQRGHGASDLGPRRPTIETLGDDLAAVLEAAVPPGRRAVLVGHSMGGMTIMAWAAQYADRMADRVSAVVLTSTAASEVLARHTLIPETAPRFSRPFHPTVSKLFTSTPVPLPQSSYSARFTQYLAFGPQARLAHIDFADSLIADCAPRARAGWGAAMGRLDVLAGLDALDVPVTVVVGSEDRLTPRFHSDRLAETLERRGTLRSLEVYDGAGHMVPMEAAGEFNKLLDQVIAEVAEEAADSGD